ncbi:MAG: hypothetical protein D6723_17145 [Acidobacteria bacterium]|nr:MAG: hypothetical protein D6723_17145 [Acidobacteriota bacterium]
MKMCREVRRYLHHTSLEPEDRRLREHIAVCRRCARAYRLLRVERELLQATLPTEGAPQPSPDFLTRLMIRWRQGPSSERWTFWEFVWNFSKPFAVITMIVLIVIGGMNVYTTDRQQRRPALMENDLIPPPVDEVDLILSEDVALTQERVLRTLVIVREENNGNRQ